MKPRNNPEDPHGMTLMNMTTLMMTPMMTLMMTLIILLMMTDLVALGDRVEVVEFDVGQGGAGQRGQVHRHHLACGRGCHGGTALNSNEADAMLTMDAMRPDR